MRDNDPATGVIVNMDYPLLPETAKHLYRKKGLYRYLVDREGVEWLVINTADKGRFINLVRAETDGKVRCHIFSIQFDKFRIVGESLSDEQEAAIKKVLKLKTKIEKRKEQKAMAAQKEPIHKLIPVKDIIPTPDNPRKVRTDSESFKSLLDSITGGGVRIPLIVRPHPKKKGKYDGLAGARRHAAAKLAGLKEVPCLVHEDMTDEAAFDLTFIENFAREDLTLLEQAQAVATLLEKHKNDFKAVADKLDKSEKWVRLRANVHGNLSDKWLEAISNIDTPELDYDASSLVLCIRHFGIGHYALIARFDKDTQDHILDDAICEDMTIDELAKACSELLMDLSTATWDKGLSTEVSDSEFKRPKCDGCPKRTSHQPLLWEDDPKKGKIDRCLDPACWKDKMAYQMAEKLAAAKAKHKDLQLLTTEYGHTENAEIAERLGDLLESSDVDTAKKSDKDAFPCFVVRGKQAGKVVWKKKVAGRSSSSSSGSRPKSMEQKRKALNSKRWCLVLKVVREVIEYAPLDSIQHEDKLLAVMALVARVGIVTNEDLWNEFIEMIVKGRDSILHDIWCGVKEHLYNSITYYGGNTQLPDSYIDNARHIIKLLGLDEEKNWADAVKEIPEPKTWAKLNENGTPKAVKKIKVKKKTKNGK